MLAFVRKVPRPEVITIDSSSESSNDTPEVCEPKESDHPTKDTEATPQEDPVISTKPYKCIIHDKSIDFNSVNEILEKVFKHSGFRTSLQKDAVIQACRFDRDLFVSLPTGSGKSLIYQLPAVYKNYGLTIVVSPLVALISNQILNAKQLGIPCATINSHMTKTWNKQVKAEISKKNNRLRLLYITPETLCSDHFRPVLGIMNRHKTLKLFAIDEAHCVSSWGHEFRPDYLKLGQLRKDFPDVPIIALTATATSKVLKDILDTLKLNNPKHIVASTFRKNLFYDVENADDLGRKLLENLARFLRKCLGMKEPAPSKPSGKRKMISAASSQPTRSLKKIAGPGGGGMFVSAASLLPSSSKVSSAPAASSESSKSKEAPGDVSPSGVAIVYCRTKLSCEEVADYLGCQGISARPYHSGLTSKQRSEIESLWMEEKVLVICATISFGMGIDKPNVRAVVHFNMSQSLANYYQESGRAGRDGKRAHCRLYYSRTDQSAISFLLRKDLEIEGSDQSVEKWGPEVCKRRQRSARAAMERFERMVEYCRSASKCRHLLLAKEFALEGESGRLVSGCGSSCDHCCLKALANPHRSQ